MKAWLARTHKGPCCDYLHSQQGLKLNFTEFSLCFCCKARWWAERSDLNKWKQQCKEISFIHTALIACKQSTSCTLLVLLFLLHTALFCLILYLESLCERRERVIQPLLAVSKEPVLQWGCLFNKTSLWLYWSITEGGWARGVFSQITHGMSKRCVIWLKYMCSVESSQSK